VGSRCEGLTTLRGGDAGFDAGVFGEQVEQVGAVDKLKRLAGGELVTTLPVAGGGHQDALAGALVLHGAEQVPHGGHPDGVLAPLRPDDDLPPKIGRASKATQSTPPSREAWVCRASSPIRMNKFPISDSNSPGLSSMRFRRVSRPESTSPVSMNRGSTVENSSAGADRGRLGGVLRHAGAEVPQARGRLDLREGQPVERLPHPLGAL
jgi:hypothetical protein